MGLTESETREGIPEEVEETLTSIEEKAYGLRKLLDEYGHHTSEEPLYSALEEIRQAIQIESGKSGVEGLGEESLHTPEAGTLANHRSR